MKIFVFAAARRTDYDWLEIYYTKVFKTFKEAKAYMDSEIDRFVLQGWNWNCDYGNKPNEPEAHLTDVTAEQDEIAMRIEEHEI